METVVLEKIISEQPVIAHRGFKTYILRLVVSEIVHDIASRRLASVLSCWIILEYVTYLN